MRARLVALVVAGCVLGLAIPVPAVASRRLQAEGTLRWSGCGGAQCARLTVPLDDANPTGPTIELALIRYPARDQEQRIGSLVVNPGGPGASGVDFLPAAIGMFPSVLRDRFDLVSFDPRGVGRSAGVDCGANLDALLALEWVPDDPGERAERDAGVRSYVEACARAVGAVLPFLTTERTARDLDRIRAALGDRRLTYLGYSYGTYLGARYAEQFPQNVRALVLDGPLDPSLDAATIQVQQAVGFERGLDRFLADCSDDDDCAFHSSGRAERAYDALRERVDRSPLPASGAGAGRVLNGTQFDLAVASLLYLGRDSWDALGSLLAAAARGDGSGLLREADGYTGRRSDGTYAHTLDAFAAIGCADGPPVGGPDGLAAIAERAARVAPRLGPSVVSGSLPCAFWPVAAAPPAPISAPGAPPILVIGTRSDPATPVAWARGLARQLSSGVLRTVAGTAHTAFPSGVDCLDGAVLDYLLERTVPRGASRC